MKRSVTVVALLFLSGPPRADLSVMGLYEWEQAAFWSPPRVEAASTFVVLQIPQENPDQQIWVTLGLEHPAMLAARSILLVRLDSTTARFYAEMIVASAEAEEMQGYENVVAGQVMMESWGNTRAVGPWVCMAYNGRRCLEWDRALGLGQIMPSVWGQYTQCQGDLFDPRINLRCATFALKGHLEECDGHLICGLNGYWGSSEYSYEESPYTKSVMAAIDG